jgi:ABC-type uncharacterized transport system permease subunit
MIDPQKITGSAGRVSVFQITIFFLYIIAGVLFGLARLQGDSAQGKMLLAVAWITGVTGILWHAWTLSLLILIPDGISLSIGNTASFIGLQIALIALLGAWENTLRGLSGGLLILAGFIAVLTGGQDPSAGTEPMSLQIQGHIMISLFAYGLLTVGAIVAIYALVQDMRLRKGLLSSFNQLFAPLETTEKLLFGITAAGFLFLLVAVSSGFAFVENLFAQHLVHKTALSLLALVLFGLLLAGRAFAGWRGKRAVYLYLGGFVILCLAYFGSRFVLEEILGRSWT